MILVDSDTKVLVQGITGSQGSFHTKKMLEGGTKIVAGVTPGKAGEKVEGIPVYNSVKEVLKEHKVDWSIIFVPAKFAKNACLEALKEGLHIVIITEGMPVHDVIAVMDVAIEKQLFVVGPNCPGLITPTETKLGIMPGHIFSKGKVGVLSRSGTLTYEIINELTQNGIGQSTVIGIGGDSVIGLNFIDLLTLFAKDPDTEKVVLIGEIGGDLEEKTAEYLKDYPKPVVAYIAGVTAPEGKRMGHAGAIISGNTGTAKGKIEALESVGVKVAKLPSEIVRLLNE